MSTENPKPLDEAAHAAALGLAERARGMARVGRVALGTAGWTDASLVKAGTFYPKDVKTPEARLRHYASVFPIAEIDATYYAILDRDLFVRWSAWTPDDFRFHVKAFPILTGHPLDLARLPADVRPLLGELGEKKKRVYPDDLPAELQAELEGRFLASIEPLITTQKLAAVLVQFPPWFEATRGNVRRIEALRARLPELPMSIEFRHGSWLEAERRERVFDMLRAGRFSCVGVDEPEAATGLPFAPEVTLDDLAVLRLHGRNLSGWTKKGASVTERFDYLYAPSELAEFVEPVRRLAERAKRVHVVFNNAVRDYAVLNARGLAALLEESDAETPP